MGKSVRVSVRVVDTTAGANVTSIERLRQHAPAHLDVETARAEWRTWLSNDAHVDRLVDGFSKALALAQ